MYCDSLGGDDSLETYQKRKGYIEHFQCKVQQPEPLYIFQNGIYKTPQIMNPSQLSILLKPIQSGFTNAQGLSVSFCDKWTNDVTHRLYRTMDFMPFNANPRVDDSNVFNFNEWEVKIARI